jgi:hypothetical protein
MLDAMWLMYMQKEERPSKDAHLGGKSNVLLLQWLYVLGMLAHDPPRLCYSVLLPQLVSTAWSPPLLPGCDDGARLRDDC